MEMCHEASGELEYYRTLRGKQTPLEIEGKLKQFREMKRKEKRMQDFFFSLDKHNCPLKWYAKLESFYQVLQADAFKRKFCIKKIL